MAALFSVSGSSQSGSSTAPAPHERARPLAKGSAYPAKDLCSQCGLCDSRWVAYVKDSCAFLEQRFEAMEEQAHGRSRDLDNDDELYFGVQQRMLTARLAQPIDGAQWTGIVSRIGVRALETGLVDAVLCVGQSEEDRFTPVPRLARTPEEVLSTRVNKPTLSSNLEVFEQLLQHSCLEIEDRTVVEQALAGVRSGLDFADALHHASCRGCEALASFDDRGFARRIRQLNLPPRVVIPRAA
jgi:hypothetical protein